MQFDDLADRVVPVQRGAAHIAVAGAGEQSDDGLDAARQPDRDALAGDEPRPGEIRRQPVGRLDERAIADARREVAHRGLVRRRLRMAPGERVDGLVPPEAGGVVLGELGGAQIRQHRIRHAKPAWAGRTTAARRLGPDERGGTRRCAFPSERKLPPLLYQNQLKFPFFDTGRKCSKYFARSRLLMQSFRGEFAPGFESWRQNRPLLRVLWPCAINSAHCIFFC